MLRSTSVVFFGFCSTVTSRPCLKRHAAVGHHPSRKWCTWCWWNLKHVILSSSRRNRCLRRDSFCNWQFFLEEHSRTENESFQKKRKWLAGSGEWGRKRRHIDASRSSALYESHYQHCTIEDAEINHAMWFSVNLAKFKRMIL